MQKLDWLDEIEAWGFDWSGTLSDDRNPVYEANMRVLDLFKKRRLTKDAWLQASTLSAFQFFQGQGIEEKDESLTALFREEFGRVTKCGTLPTIYPHAHALFERLWWNSKPVLRLGIVSSHPQAFLVEEAQEYDLGEFLDVIIGGAKDEAAKTAGIRSFLGAIPAERAVYVGDTIFDMRAAGAIKGLRRIAVAHGYHARERLLEEQPDAVVSSLEELIALLPAP